MKIPWLTTKAGRLTEAPAAAQRAFLEAAVMVVLVDGRHRLAEAVEFHALCRRVAWRLDLEAELPQVEDRVVGAIQDADRMRAFVAGIGQAISDEGVAKAVLGVYSDLALAASSRVSPARLLFVETLERALRDARRATTAHGLSGPPGPAG